MATKTEEHVDRLSEEMQSLLTKHPSLIYDSEIEKIRCSLSGHEMPPREDTVKAYVGGKKYKKLKSSQYDYDKYQPHIVPNIKKFNQGKLFCNLTLRTLSKTPEDIERHVNGKRFKKALARWEDCQKKGIEFKARLPRKCAPINKEDTVKVADSDLNPAMDDSLEDEEEGEEEEKSESESDNENNDIEDKRPRKTNSLPPSHKRKAEKQVVKKKKLKQIKKKQKVG